VRHERQRARRRQSHPHPRERSRPQSRRPLETCRGHAASARHSPPARRAGACGRGPRPRPGARASRRRPAHQHFDVSVAVSSTSPFTAPPPRSRPIRRSQLEPSRPAATAVIDRVDSPSTANASSSPRPLAGGRRSPHSIATTPRSSISSSPRPKASTASRRTDPDGRACARPRGVLVDERERGAAHRPPAFRVRQAGHEARLARAQRTLDQQQIAGDERGARVRRPAPRSARAHGAPHDGRRVRPPSSARAGAAGSRAAASSLERDPAMLERTTEVAFELVEARRVSK